LLIGTQFGIKLRELYINGFYAAIDLRGVSLELQETGEATRTFEMALFNVGLGALLLAPNSRFMAGK